MKNLLKISFLLVFSIIVSCEKESDNDPNETHPVQKEVINGFVQKGPFINGSSITISELNSDLIQTGKIFSTQISDNKGSFELKQLELSSQFVELKADGFYFNEVTGDKSSAQLTLYALSDLTDKNSINVNILSHLEKSRINYLVSQGSGFADAKNQAQREILKIFSINKSDILESELLDISKDGDDNAILLAISAILQGFRTDAELSELLANMSSDIKEDGVLNSSGLGTELINHAQFLNLPKIRENLVSRYEDMGVAVTIPDFEKYVQLFEDSTDFKLTDSITYPQYGINGENLLYLNKTEYNVNDDYVFYAVLPAGTNIKIRYNRYRFYPIYGVDNIGWQNLGMDDNIVETIVSTKTGEIEYRIGIDERIDPNEDYGYDLGDFFIYIYENNDTVPKYVKIIDAYKE